MTINVSIVEDNTGTREGLVKLFNRADGFACQRSYPTGEAAVLGIPNETPQVALIDINLPGISGIECVRQLKNLCPEMHVLMLTTYEESDLIFESLRAGANGYLLKKMPAKELIEAVQQVHAGGAPMSMQIARKVVAHFHRLKEAPGEMSQLTKRENEILGCLAKGFLYKEIAEYLQISYATVRTHIERIYQKLHVRSRSQAVAKFHHL